MRFANFALEDPLRIPQMSKKLVCFKYFAFEESLRIPQMGKSQYVLRILHSSPLRIPQMSKKLVGSQVRAIK